MQAGNINQSLLTLGRVITKLVERAGHIPYRYCVVPVSLTESNPLTRECRFLLPVPWISCKCMGLIGRTT